MTALHKTHGGTLSYRELGAQYGLSADAVRSRIRYHTYKLGLNGANGGKTAQAQEFGHVGEVVTPTIPAYKAPIPAPTTLYRPYPAGDDTPLWDEWKQKRVNRANGRYTIIQAASAGCHSNIPPHYQGRRKQDSQWIHGAIVAHVRLDADLVELQDIIYQCDPDGGLCCYYGSTFVTSNQRIGYAESEATK